MFFSKKGAGLAGKVAEVLAAYFSLTAKDTQPWCSEEKNDKGVQITITLPFCAKSQFSNIEQHLIAALKGKLKQGQLHIRQHIDSHVTHVEPVTNIKNVIAVASGKGGVGKSTTSVNLAFALMQEGARVGILDADIYGPSIPIMLGNDGEHPESSDNKHMQPLRAHGMVANSIGYLVPQEDAAVWRGPMASRALKQLLDETLWPVWIILLWICRRAPAIFS